MSRTFKDDPREEAREHRRALRHVRSRPSDGFRCRQCGMVCGPARFGGRHRNHCPFCLYSLHVDGRVPGDRASDCRSRMVPAGVFARRNGEQVIIHRCLGCGFARYCRVAGDDDIPAVMRLPVVAAPAAAPRRAQTA